MDDDDWIVEATLARNLQRIGDDFQMREHHDHFYDRLRGYFRYVMDEIWRLLPQISLQMMRSAGCF